MRSRVHGSALALLLIGAPAFAYAQTSDLLQAARARCEAYGFQPGSEGQARCVQQLVEKVERGQATQEAREKLANECWWTIFNRYSSQIGVATAEANRCNSDPYAHLRRIEVVPRR